MRKYLGLTRRNLLIYFKDKQSIFFSMLTPIIIFVLYLLFLKDTFVDPIESAAVLLGNYISADDIDMFVDGLLFAGLLGSSMITVPYNALMTVVRDRENRIDYDICATPVRRWQIVLAYFTASAISAFIMSALILTAGLIILMLRGSLYLTAADVLKLYGITMLGSVSATALFMIVVLFFRTSAASGAFLGLLSAGTGFIIGAYIPLSRFSTGVQTFCNLFPGSGITILYRNALLNPILNHINDGIGGIDGGRFVQDVKEIFAFESYLFGETVGQNGIILQVAVIAAVSVLVIVLIYPKVYQRK